MPRLNVDRHGIRLANLGVLVALLGRGTGSRTGVASAGQCIAPLSAVAENPIVAILIAQAIDTSIQLFIAESIAARRITAHATQFGVAPFCAVAEFPVVTGAVIGCMGASVSLGIAMIRGAVVLIIADDGRSTVARAGSKVAPLRSVAKDAVVAVEIVYTFDAAVSGLVTELIRTRVPSRGATRIRVTGLLTIAKQAIVTRVAARREHAVVDIRITGIDGAILSVVARFGRSRLTTEVDITPFHAVTKGPVVAPIIDRAVDTGIETLIAGVDGATKTVVAIHRSAESTTKGGVAKLRAVAIGRVQACAVVRSAVADTGVYIASINGAGNAIRAARV